MAAGYSIRIAVSAALLGLAACAPAAGTSGAADGPAPEATVVRVANNGWADVTVYLLDGGMRRRLGMVTGLSSQTFRLPPAAVSSARPLQLLASPVGGSSSFVSTPWRVSPGQAIAMRVNQSLSMSTVSVFDR
jgi:hypothetical protein